jgi:hypothetical protein
MSDDGHRITELYAFAAVDSVDDSEGICAFPHGGFMMPMVGSDTARVNALRPIARVIADQLGVPIHVLRFTVREEIETITPKEERDVLEVLGFAAVWPVPLIDELGEHGRHGRHRQ